jgi:hypothetical protein
MINFSAQTNFLVKSNILSLTGSSEELVMNSKPISDKLLIVFRCLKSKSMFIIPQML